MKEGKFADRDYLVVTFLQQQEKLQHCDLLNLGLNFQTPGMLVSIYGRRSQIKKGNYFLILFHSLLSINIDHAKCLAVLLIC